MTHSLNVLIQNFTKDSLKKSAKPIVVDAISSYTYPLWLFINNLTEIVDFNKNYTNCWDSHKSAVVDLTYNFRDASLANITTEANRFEGNLLRVLERIRVVVLKLNQALKKCNGREKCVVNHVSRNFFLKTWIK